MADFDMAAVRLSALGDVVLTTGVLEHWHRERGLRFGVITRESLAPLFQGSPAVPRVIGLKEERLRSNWSTLANELTREFGGLPLVDLHNVGRTWLLASMWKGKVRRYPKFSFSRRFYRRFRLGWARRRLEALNVPQRYALALDRAAPPREALRPVIRVSDEERDQARQALAELGLGSRPLAALHPYATHHNKAWPRERWLELLDLLDEAGWEWLVLGRSSAPFLKERAGPRDLTGATSLRATCALIQAADALVTGDSGPMHLGTAVSTPVAALFGPTTSAWGFTPSGERDVVLQVDDLACRPCDIHGGAFCRRELACLAGIPASRVMDELSRLA